MLESWFGPVLSWLGIGFVPFLLLIIIILLIINIIRG